MTDIERLREAADRLREAIGRLDLEGHPFYDVQRLYRAIAEYEAMREAITKT